MFRGAKQTKREGTDGGGEDIEKLELPEVVRREDTVRCSPERSHHLRWHRPAGGARCRDLTGPHIPWAGGLAARDPCILLCTHTHFSRCLLWGAWRPSQRSGREIPTVGLPGVAPQPRVCGHAAWLWWFVGKITDSRKKIEGMGEDSPFLGH